MAVMFFLSVLAGVVSVYIVRALDKFFGNKKN